MQAELILKYDSENSTETEEIDRVLKATPMALALWRFQEYLISEINDNEQEHLRPVLDRFQYDLNDRGIDLNRLVS